MRKNATDANGLNGRFFYLLLAQVSILTLYPYFDRQGVSMVIFRLLAALAFVAGIYAVSEKRHNWAIALALATPAGVLNTLAVVRPDLHTEVPALACGILFVGFTLVTLLRAVLRCERVTPDTIYGAISVYILMAMLWAIAYLLLSRLQPGAMSLDPTRHPNQIFDWADSLFFSFVTLTSTGYGDIVPVSAHARSLAVLEAVSGTMYLAVLVARLVGLYSASQRGTATADQDHAAVLAKAVQR